MIAGRTERRPLTEQEKETVNENIGLAYNLTNKKPSKVIERNDQDQYGVVDLMKAVQGFKPEKGVKLSTYATRAIINGRVKREGDEMLIRIPYYLRQKKFKTHRNQEYVRRIASRTGIHMMDDDSHPASHANDRDEFSFDAIEDVRAAVQGLPPIERDIVTGLIYRDESLKHLSRKHALCMYRVREHKDNAFAKLRASLQNHV